MPKRKEVEVSDMFGNKYKNWEIECSSCHNVYTDSKISRKCEDCRKQRRLPERELRRLGEQGYR